MTISVQQVIAGMLLLLEGYADSSDIKFAIEKMKKVGFSIDKEARIAGGYSVHELDNKNNPRYETKKRELESIATAEVIEFLKGLDIKELILRKFNSGSISVYQSITPGIMEAYKEGYLNFDFNNYSYSISEKGIDYLAAIDRELESDSFSRNDISRERKIKTNLSDIS